MADEFGMAFIHEGQKQMPETEKWLRTYKL